MNSANFAGLEFSEVGAWEHAVLSVPDPTLEPPPSDDLGAPYFLLDHLEARLRRARKAYYPSTRVLGGHLLQAVLPTG